MPYKDKRKQQQAQRRSYLRNKIKHQASTNKSRTARREVLAQIVREAKDQPCADCGVAYPYYVMDLDHVRGEKVAAIGYLVNGPSTKEMLLEEIAKCEVVCANCHRERTQQRLGL